MQFLSKAQVWQLTEIVDAFQRSGAGLRPAHRLPGELFEGSQYLLAWADSISEIKTIPPQRPQGHDGGARG